MDLNTAFNIQSSFNKKLILVIAAGVAYAYFNEKRFTKVASELKELKQTKGV